MKKVPIIDLHTCIQGEGILAGVPHLLVRVAGCNLRCMFGNSTCDTPYSSFTPERSKFNFTDIEQMVNNNPQIRHILLTGGEPCLYPEFIERIIETFSGLYVTVETNGTIDLPQDISSRIDLISISPKLTSSVPTKEKAEILGVTYSEEAELKHRTSINILSLIISLVYSPIRYQLKYVINDQADIDEVLSQLEFFGKNIKKSKVFLMPAGVTNEQLQEKRAWLMEKCIELGFNYTDRLQILAYGNMRGV